MSPTGPSWDTGSIESEFTLRESRYWAMARRYTKQLRDLLNNLLIMNPKP